MYLRGRDEVWSVCQRSITRFVKTIRHVPEVEVRDLGLGEHLRDRQCEHFATMPPEHIAIGGMCQKAWRCPCPLRTDCGKLGYRDA